MGKKQKKKAATASDSTNTTDVGTQWIKSQSEPISCVPLWCIERKRLWVSVNEKSKNAESFWMFCKSENEPSD